MRRGVLELCVLSMISREATYPSDLIRQLKDMDMIVVEGTLYPLMTRLKNEGFLNYSWEESPVGPPRKIYQITETGLSFLNGLLDTWSDLVHTVKQSTKNIHHNE